MLTVNDWAKWNAEHKGEAERGGGDDNEKQAAAAANQREGENYHRRQAMYFQGQAAGKNGGIFQHMWASKHNTLAEAHGQRARDLEQDRMHHSEVKEGDKYQKASFLKKLLKPGEGSVFNTQAELEEAALFAIQNR